MELIREMLASGAVLLLLAACIWWLRHKGLARYASGGARPRALEVVQRAALSPHHSLHVVRLAGRGLLVGVSPAGLTVLESFDWSSFKPALSAPDVETR